MDREKEILRLKGMLEFGKNKYKELTYKGKGRGNILKTNNAIKKKLKELYALEVQDETN